MQRNLLALVAGFVTWTVVFLGGNQITLALFSARVAEDGTTSDPVVLLPTLLLSCLASLAAGWITAKLAVLGQGVRLGWIQGGLLLVVGIFVQASVWSSMPVWYHLLFLALLVPITVAGAKLGTPSAAPSATPV